MQLDRRDHFDICASDDRVSFIVVWRLFLLEASADNPGLNFVFEDDLSCSSPHDSVDVLSRCGVKVLEDDSQLVDFDFLVEIWLLNFGNFERLLTRILSFQEKNLFYFRVKAFDNLCLHWLVLKL